MAMAGASRTRNFFAFILPIAEVKDSDKNEVYNPRWINKMRRKKQASIYFEAFHCRLFNFQSHLMCASIREKKTKGRALSTKHQGQEMAYACHTHHKHMQLK